MYVITQNTMTLAKVNLKQIIIHISMSFMYEVRGELANTLVLSATMVRQVVMLSVVRPGILNEI